MFVSITDSSGGGAIVASVLAFIALDSSGAVRYKQMIPCLRAADCNIPTRFTTTFAVLRANLTRSLRCRRREL
jgi:hypothetical protein